jgi:hypothetical protein
LGLERVFPKSFPSSWKNKFYWNPNKPFPIWLTNCNKLNKLSDV